MTQPELQRYLSDLDSVDVDVRQEAIKNIVLIEGQSAIPILLAGLKDNHKFIRAFAFKCLVELTGTRYRDHIVHILSDDTDLVQEHAVKILRSLAVAQLEPLLDEAHNPNILVRANLAKIFNNKQSKKAFDFLIVALTDREEYVRRSAAYGLEGCNNPEAVPHLIKRLYDVSSLVRSASARSLGRIGDLSALEPLLEALATETHLLARLGIIWGLGYLQDERAAKTLLNITLDRSEPINIQLSTVGALTNMGSLGKRTLREIARKASRTEVRADAYDALKDI